MRKVARRKALQRQKLRRKNPKRRSSVAPHRWAGQSWIGLCPDPSQRWHVGHRAGCGSLVDPLDQARHGSSWVRTTWVGTDRTRRHSRLDEHHGPSPQRPPARIRLTADDLVLLHDDLDLDPGRLRIKQAGGHGGHNGIKSVIEAIGTTQFVRVKIGIGRPAPGQDSADYVLETVTKEEMDVLEPCLERAVDALECLIHRGIAVAMNQFNVREMPTEGEEGEAADVPRKRVGGGVGEMIEALIGRPS